MDFKSTNIGIEWIKSSVLGILSFFFRFCFLKGLIRMINLSVASTTYFEINLQRMYVICYSNEY